MTSREEIYALLEQVSDPEVPVLSVLDLGMVRDVQVNADSVTVLVTPTYSGCPATGTIAMDIRMKLLEHGFKKIDVKTVLSPAWTTDWMTEAGKQKLEAYGIAPPIEPVGSMNELFAKDVVVPCPRCKSSDTRMISQFGSTACKALYQCNDCHEPFDYFKCHR